MMNPLIVKILAVGMTITQVFLRPPQDFKPSFDAATEKAQVEQLLSEGCRFMISEFKADSIDFDFMFSMMIENAERNKATAAQAALTTGAPSEEKEKSFSDQMFEQMDLPAMRAAYNQFCKGQVVPNSPIVLEEVIAFYNKAIGTLPDANELKGKRLPEASILLDRDGNKFTEVYSDDGRRRWVSIAELPSHVKDAFVAAEDQRFFQHNGLDIRGIIRAFANNFMGSGRPQGGSTITQQVVKNLLVGDDLTFERKMREMAVARRVEEVLSKDEILELYINYVFLGRASWGIEMAAQSYFGKPAKALSVAEAALLAGLTKGPNYYHVELHADRALDRRQYVIGRLAEDGYVAAELAEAAKAEPVAVIPYDPPRTKGGFFFIDEVNRRAKEVAGIPSLTSGSYTIRSTMHPTLQKATELALQEGLYKYEAESGRAEWKGPEGNLEKDIVDYKSTWQETLPKVRPKLFDVQWPLAVVVKPASGENSRVIVGLADGRESRLLDATPSIRRSLKQWDLIHVQVTGEGENTRIGLRIPTTVQGAAVIIENKTGRVLAMSGGFAFANTQLNRVTQTARQPGSTLKPFIYLAALGTGYFQPNTLIPDSSPRLPPLRRGEKVWRPKNYDGGSRGLVTVRTAIEKSLNLPTVRVMAALGATPGEGLDYVRAVTQQLGIYKETERVYPFVLGAQPARLIDIAMAYSTIANDGLRAQPQFIDTIEQGGKLLYERPRFALQPLPSIDRVAFYQLRRILMGTLDRGTATAMKEHSGAIAGKTGTSNDENDAWFVGFTNDITVAVWIGYDSRNIRPSLGARFTGGRVALPIAHQIFNDSFRLYKEKAPMAPPPAEIASLITEQGITVSSGRLGGNFPEVFRLDAGGSFNGSSNIVRPEDGALDISPNVVGEEDSYEQMPMFGDDDQFPIQEDDWEDEDQYEPGAEDMYDIWRGRDVEPFFADPFIFGND